MACINKGPMSVKAPLSLIFQPNSSIFLRKRGFPVQATRCLHPALRAAVADVSTRGPAAALVTERLWVRAEGPLSGVTGKGLTFNLSLSLFLHL